VLLCAALLSVTLSLPASAQISLHLFPTQYDSGRRVVINGVVTTPQGRIVKIAWGWGDGSGEESAFPASHTYDSDGTYLVSVMAQRNDRRVAMAYTRVYISSALAGHRQLLERSHITVYDLLALTLILTVIIGVALRILLNITPFHKPPFRWIAFVRIIAPFVVLVSGALFSHDTRSSVALFAYGFALVLFQTHLVKVIGGIVWMLVVFLAVAYLIANAFGLLDMIGLLNIMVGTWLNFVVGNPRPSSGPVIGVICALMFLYVPAEWPLRSGIVSRLLNYQPQLPSSWQGNHLEAKRATFELAWRGLSYAAGLGLLVAAFRLLAVSRLLAVICALGSVVLWRQVVAARCPRCGRLMAPDPKSPFGDFDDSVTPVDVKAVGLPFNFAPFARMLSLVKDLEAPDYSCIGCGYPHGEAIKAPRHPERSPRQ